MDEMASLRSAARFNMFRIKIDSATAAAFSKPIFEPKRTPKFAQKSLYLFILSLAIDSKIDRAV
jgi:hypothetical protein